MIRSLATGLVGVLLLIVAPLTFAADDFGGVGVQVVPVSTGELAVLHVVTGSPAAVSGILPGDLITKVSGHPMRGSNFEEVTQKYLWGKVGTTVVLVWLRPGVADPMLAEMTRVAIPKDMKVKTIPGVTIATPE